MTMTFGLDKQVTVMSLRERENLGGRAGLGWGPVERQ